MAETIMVCTPKSLPKDLWIRAAHTAAEINPVNHAPLHQLVGVIPGFMPTPEHIDLLGQREDIFRRLTDDHIHNFIANQRVLGTDLRRLRPRVT